MPTPVPARTCVACRSVETKSTLLRLVQTDGGLVVDLTGKREGRGAYLHASAACWAVVTRKPQLLVRALKLPDGSLSSDQVAQLQIVGEWKE